MANNGIALLKTYIRGELARTKALQDFNSALTLLESFESQEAIMKAKLSALAQDVDKAEAKTAKRLAVLAAELEEAEALHAAALEKHSKNSKARIDEYIEDNAVKIAEANKKLAGVLAKIDAKQTKLDELSDKESGMISTLAALEAKKEELDALVAKIKSV